MLPMLSHCCCGCSLQTGSILIGAYQLVVGIYNIFNDALLADSLKLQRHHEDGWQSLWDGFPFAMLAFNVLRIIASFFLIFGANKERYRLVFWWLIVTSALTIIDLACFPLNMIDFFKYSYTIEAVITLVVAVIDLLFSAYFLWVVYSYYRIIEERTPAATELTA